MPFRDAKERALCVECKEEASLRCKQCKSPLCGLHEVETKCVPCAAEEFAEGERVKRAAIPYLIVGYGAVFTGIAIPVIAPFATLAAGALVVYAISRGRRKQKLQRLLQESSKAPKLLLSENESKREL